MLLLIRWVSLNWASSTEMRYVESTKTRMKYCMGGVFFIFSLLCCLFNA